MKWIWLAFVAMLVSCSFVGNDKQCSPGHDYCDSQGRAHECDAYQSMWDDPTQWKVTDCGGPDRCRMDGSGRPFCILDPKTAPKCTVYEGQVCDADGLMYCESGYPIMWQVCAQCAADGVTCASVFGSCSASGCPGGLVCRTGPAYGGGTRSWCDAPCTCPDDQPCTDCDAFGETGMSPFHCLDEWCSQSP